MRGRRLPLRFDLHVGADNASRYRYDLRLVQLEWTLLLEDRETVSGVFVRFFDGGANDLVQVALRAVGAGGPVNVKLRARPTLRTPLGPVRFPNEITIASRPS